MINSITKEKTCCEVVEPVTSDYIDISKSLQSNYFCVFSKFPSLIYEIQSFSLPSTTSRKITIARPKTTDYFVAGHTADYDELSLTLIMSEDFKNYFNILKWMRDNESKDKFNDTIASLSLFITNNAKIPIIRIDFREVIPTYLSGITYNIQNSDVITWDMTLSAYSYKVIYLDNSMTVYIEK